MPLASVLPPLPVSIKDSKRTQVLASVVKLSTATTFQLSMKFLSQQPTWSTVIIVQHQIQLVPFTHRFSYCFSLYFSVLQYLAVSPFLFWLPLLTIFTLFVALKQLVPPQQTCTRWRMWIHDTVTHKGHDSMYTKIRSRFWQIKHENGRKWKYVKRKRSAQIFFKIRRWEKNRNQAWDIWNEWERGF